MKTRPRILIVEDDDDWRKRLAGYLKTEPYQVEAVDNYSGAIRLLKKRYFHVIVLDLQLTDSGDGFEGIELLQFLQEKNSKIPVIIVSAHDEHTRNGFKLYHVHDFLSKQKFDRKAYQQTIQEAILQSQPSQILIVDDDENWFKKISLSLEHEGYSIEFATNYDEALKIIERENIDVMCTEVLHQEGMTVGWKLDWTNLLAKAKHKEIDVIVITSMDKVELYHEIVEYGVKAVFSKNEISQDNLLKKVKEIVSNKKKISGFPKTDSTDFDVFLAHNSLDKAEIETIAEKLKQRGLKPWIDKEQIPPGRWFQDVIQEAIRNVKTAAIFLSPSGLGKWQIVELRAFISCCVEANIPVIPVLLPGVNEIPENLLFLKELNWVSFKSIDDVEALDNLVWGITGEQSKRP